MKQVVFLIIFFLFPLSAQAADVAPISGAFKAGNASTLTSYMDALVDMAVPGTTKRCAPGEAVALLNTFFNANKPSNFAVVHNADKKESGFLVGKLTTPRGEFRVNVTYRTEGDKILIQSIRIE